MARMIPAFFDDCTPPGERAVFNMLSGGPSEWVVLHALDLAPWNNRRRTEVDFVIVIPDTGILCVEVKSHKKITFQNDQWSPPEIRRSPFKQAQDGSKTFYRGLKRLEPKLYSFPVTHLCIFTNSPFYIGDILSIAPWELVDSQEFQQFQDCSSFCTELAKRLQTSIKEDPDLRPTTHPLAPYYIDRIINHCLPVQKHQPDARSEISHRQLELDKILRDQQKPVMTLARVNNTVIVSGAAGTGKTLIAMELALEFAKQGKRVGFLCFNRLIGDWLTSKINNLEFSLPNLVVGRLYQVMSEICGISIPDTPSNEFWSVKFPELIEEKFTDPDFRGVAEFDYLVVDEAQDLLSRPHLWACVVQLLKGGLKAGYYTLFGDFEHQVMGHKTKMENELIKVFEISKPARYTLTENCRNYQIVGETAVKLTGFCDDVYSRYMRTGGSHENYEIHFFETNDDQIIQLKKLITDCLDRRFRPSEISLLSFCSPEKSVAHSLSLNDSRLKPAGRSDKHITYTSISAYKGMENKIIILTDVHPDDREFNRDLFYTGMTRCTDSVYVLCALDAKKTLAGWLSEAI